LSDGWRSDPLAVPVLRSGARVPGVHSAPVLGPASPAGRLVSRLL